MRQITEEFREKYLLGICALDKKAYSPPMQAILENLISYKDCEVVYFGDHVIHNQPVEKWPLCDCVIAFFSKGYPLEKAIDYVRLRRPFCINDLEPQTILWDRRAVLRRLVNAGVPTAKHLFVNRENQDWNNEASFVENIEEEYIEVDGTRLYKPFVEKPHDGENHNIRIYYPKSMGGGCRKLFRKVHNKSSEFDPSLELVRRDDSYVYEEFIQVENSQDVKIYAVGPSYAHAECRKSPVVDGVVQRKEDGKELRYSTALTEDERNISAHVVKAFNQVVCGFDVLRLPNGQSLVCDVNGWSFVKGNEDYYLHCSEILRSLFKRYIECRPLDGRVARYFIKHQPLVSDLGTDPHYKLEGTVVIFRHADRTPKQKQKFTIKHDRMKDLFPSNPDDEYEFRDKDKLRHLLSVISELYDQRKDLKESEAQISQIKDLLENIIDDEGTKIQLRFKSEFKQISESETLLVKVPQLVCKWGGEITHVGLQQARQLGECFREYVLPMVDEEDLNESNIVIASSAEARNKRSALEFGKALLCKNIQQDFIVVNKKTKLLLDDSKNARDDMDEVKAKLHLLLSGISPESETSLNLLKRCGISRVHIPQTRLKELYHLFQEWIARLEGDLRSKKQVSQKIYCRESLFMIVERLKKLLKSYHTPKPDECAFDISKIADLYDNIKYDYIHHQEIIGPDGRKAYNLAKELASINVPSEFGIMAYDKINIGMHISGPLLNQICGDLKRSTEAGSFLSHFYVTNETHIHALRNILTLSHIGRLCEIDDASLAVPDYCATYMFEAFKNVNPTSPFFGKLYVRVKYSCGAVEDPEIGDKHFTPPMTREEPFQVLYPGVPIELLESTTKYWISEKKAYYNNCDSILLSD